jgi:hypothetical protein
MEVDMEGFRDIYKQVYGADLLSDKELFVIIFGNSALAWFPASPNLELLIRSKETLARSDFDFVLSCNVCGSTDGSYSFIQFALDELRNWRTWLAALISAGIALGVFFSGPRSEAVSSGPTSVPALPVPPLDTSSELLGAMIPAVALFLSVFVMFAVSQRSLSEKDAALMKSPVYFRYVQVDKYVAWVLAAGLLAGVGSLIGAASDRPPLSNYIGTGAFTLGMLAISAFAVAWGVTSLVGFYFERSAVLQNLATIPHLKKDLQAEYDGLKEPGE